MSVLQVPEYPIYPKADERSERNIATLLEAIRPVARAFVYLVNQSLAMDGVTCKIISGNRTYTEQDALYAKGRTAGGSIVTRARAGYSNHNFRIAWDIGLFRGAEYLPESKIYQKAVAVGRSLGLECGADWKSIVDVPHFNIKTGKSMAQLRADVKANRSVLTGVKLPTLPLPPKPKISTIANQSGIAPTDGWLVVQGSEVYGVPYYYAADGSTYLPARSFIEALGKDPDPLGFDKGELTYNGAVIPDVAELRDFTGRAWGAVRGLAEFCGYAIQMEPGSKTIHLEPAVPTK